MIYIFDKTQAIIKVLTNDDFTAAHLNFKINTATTFEFSLPANKALPSGSKYVATPHPLNDSKFIMLRLTERVDNTETIDYSAYELAYQELATDGYIEDKRPKNQSALNLMKIALDGSNWELNNVNVSGTATTNFYYIDRLSAISKVVDLLGGEIVFYIEIQGNAISGRYMDYLARQGADTSKVFASGSNLLTVERQSDTSNIYTAILPRGKGEEIDNGEADTPDGYGRRINIADVEWKKSSGNPLDKPKGSIVLLDPDATAEWGQINGNARLLLQTYDDIDDVNVLISSAYKTLQSVNHPQIQYSATVADVGGLSLGDTVLIMHSDRELSYKTRVFEVKYDLLSPDQTELSLGDDLSSNSITSQINSLNAVADTTSSQTQWTINQIGRPSTTFGNTGPANPKVGDVFFKELPDGGTEIYRWNGDIWELLASPTTADDIAAGVTEAVSQANSHTDEVKQGLSTDIDAAKSQAASQASTAEANAKSAATSQFTQAQNALSAAKTDLTNSIASEASERNQAVAAANSQAQTYVSQAKSDITDTINALSVGGRNYFIMSAAVSGYVNTDGGVTPSSTANSDVASDFINVSPNDTWQLTSWSAPNLSGNIVYAYYDSSKKFISGSRVITSMSATTPSLTVPIKIPSGVAHIRVSSQHVGNNQGALAKVEKGTKPTDWSQAPEDVVYDYTDKDNQIKQTFTQYKDTNDGKVTKAQTDATTALGLIETKVSQTVYDQKTGDLSTKINDVKQTADSSAQIIADIQEADGKQDARMSEIENTASGLKSTVSDLSTAQGKQSGDISTLQQRADGFEATVTKVDNLAVGGRNYFQIVNSVVGYINTDGTLNSTSSFGVKTSDYIKVNAGDTWQLTYWPSDTDARRMLYAMYDSSNNLVGSRMNLDVPSDKDSATASLLIPSGVTKIRVGAQYMSDDSSKIKAELGTVATDWTPAPEDIDSATATAQLTANEASAAVTKLTNADGIITKAQADIKANADAITEKVSKTDYNQKTGDLTEAVSKAQRTADGAVSTVGNYQTSNDGRVSDAESKIDQNSKDITTKVSQTDYDQKTGELSGSISTLKQRADGFEATVTKVDNLAVGGRNYYQIATSVTGYIGTDGVIVASSSIGVRTSDYIPVTTGDTWQLTYWPSDTTARRMLYAMYNTSGSLVGSRVAVDVPTTTDSSTVSVVIPSGVTKIRVGGQYMAGGSSKIKAELGTLGTDWTAAPEDIESDISQVSQKADSISNFIRDSSGNISSDFQTALSKTSIITGSTLATSIQTQTSSQITSALTDNNKNIIAMINLDTSGVQIAGKNIVLNGDTTVTGDFYAKGGNFKNLNASNITVGTLNGSQVNITNVNVNSLVGNVSSFIQSNWNGKYSSTTITELGMTIGEFSKYGYDTTFDKTGMTFTTKDARYGYAKSHFGTNTIVSNSNQIVGYGTEISFGTNNGVGFDYFAIMAPGDNNLQFGKFTAPGHVSIAITGDKGLSPFFGAGVNILDDVHMAKGMTVNGDMFVNTIHGANAFNLFNIIKGKRICIPTSFRSNGTAETWLNIQM